MSETNYKDDAKKVIESLGGSRNIVSVTLNVDKYNSEIKSELKNYNKVNLGILDTVFGVRSAYYSDNLFHIGVDISIVEGLYAEVVNVLKGSDDSKKHTVDEKQDVNREESDAVREFLDIYHNKIKEIKSQRDALSGKLEELQKKVSEYEYEKTGKDRIIERLTKENKDLKEQISKLQKSNVDGVKVEKSTDKVKDVDTIKLEKRISNLEKSVNQLKKEAGKERGSSEIPINERGSEKFRNSFLNDLFVF